MARPSVFECEVCLKLFTSKSAWSQHQRACIYHAGLLKVPAPAQPEPPVSGELKKNNSAGNSKVPQRMSRFWENRRPFGDPDLSFISDTVLHVCATKRKLGYGQLFTYVFCNLDYPQNIHWLHTREMGLYTIVVNETNGYDIRLTQDVLHDILVILNRLICDFYVRRGHDIEDADGRAFHETTMRERIAKKMFYGAFLPATMIRSQAFDFYMIHLKNAYRAQEGFQEKVKECAARTLPMELFPV